MYFKKNKTNINNKKLCSALRYIDNFKKYKLARILNNTLSWIKLGQFIKMLLMLRLNISNLITIKYHHKLQKLNKLKKKHYS